MKEMKLTKNDVQQRVLQNGKPLGLDKFEWDERARVFSTSEHELVLDFNGIDTVTFKTSFRCTFKTGSSCTFNTGFNCTFNTGFNCTFNTGSDCTFNTGSSCTFNTGSDCTFKSSSSCTFNTRSSCTFNTGSDCTFKTGFRCTFNTGSSCTFNTGSESVIIRRHIFKVITPKDNQTIQLCPYDVPGYLAEINGKMYLNGDESLGEHIIIDNILSKVLSRRKNVLKVVNHNETKPSYIVESNGIFAHGKTIKEAKDSLIYKISDRDTSQFNDLTPETVLSKEESIKMYRVITGACEYGTRQFVEAQSNLKDEYKVSEIVDLTKGHFGHEALVSFLGAR